MGYVAITAGLFALGAWAGRNLTGGVGIVAFILAFIALIAMRFTVRRSVPATVGLLAAFGLLIGVAVAPTVAYYGSMDPRALWQAGGATALFIAGFGAAGYATRRDLAPLARVAFWALVVLIVAGVVLTDQAVAPLLAASIFLDVLNVFFFFLEIFSGSER
jgi:modulator of FtsH protease